MSEYVYSVANYSRNFRSKFNKKKSSHNICGGQLLFKKKPEILTVFSFNLLFCFLYEYREEEEEKNCKNSNFDGFKCRISCLENIIVKQYSEQIHSNMQWKTKRKKGKK